MLWWWWQCTASLPRKIWRLSFCNKSQQQLAPHLKCHGRLHLTRDIPLPPSLSGDRAASTIVWRKTNKKFCMSFLVMVLLLCYLYTYSYMCCWKMVRLVFSYASRDATPHFLAEMSNKFSVRYLSFYSIPCTPDQLHHIHICCTTNIFRILQLWRL